MRDKFTDMKHSKTHINFAENIGKLCFKNHSYGIGGVNSMPMPDNVVQGMEKLKPKLIRIFIQEFFFIYDENNTLDFTKLDAYMKAVHDTGADIMASICIKPKLLYPVVDENIWMPNDVERWKYIIYEMVKRYSVDNKYVTHWGVGNEMNIGESGGCPYKINDVRDYFEYYCMTTEAIIDACPDIKVGGPSFAGVYDATYRFFDEFIQLCKTKGIRLDFISYNIYSDNPEHHVKGASTVCDIVNKYGMNINVYVTEMNIGIGGEVSIEEKAYSSKRAAGLAAVILEYNEKVPDVGTFQYHIYDQYCDPNEFSPFYARHRYMANHWNDEPHRLGLFDLNGNPRPQYHMYAMLNELVPNRVEAVTDNPDIKVIASNTSTSDKITIFMTNYNINESHDTVMSLYFKNSFSGITQMTVKCIDDIYPDGSKITEDRLTYIHDDFWFSVYLPADSCTLITFTQSDQMLL